MFHVREGYKRAVRVHPLTFGNQTSNIMLFVCLEMLELEKIGVSSVGFPAAHGEL